jgi:ribose transport system substrate-binding protein
MQPLRLIRFTALTLALAVTWPCHAQTKKPDKAGISVQDLGNPFFVQIVRGAETKIKEYNPSAKISSVSSNYDVARQTGQIDDFINAGNQLVILNAANSQGIAPAVRRLKEAKIPVVAVDVSAEGGVDATVMSDNRQAGEKAGQYIADRLKGKGQVVIINGDPVSATLDRVAGVIKVLEKYPEIKILSKDQNGSGTRDGGLRVMTDLLTAFPKIDAVFAVNDPSGIGADLAARQANRTDLFIAAVDGSPDAVTALKDQKSLFAATSAQDPYVMAQKAVELGMKVLNGESLEAQTVLIPVDLVTRDNVKDYKGWTK